MICFQALYKCRGHKEDKMTKWIKSHLRTISIAVGIVILLCLGDALFKGYWAGVLVLGAIVGVGAWCLNKWG